MLERHLSGVVRISHFVCDSGIMTADQCLDMVQASISFLYPYNYFVLQWWSQPLFCLPGKTESLAHSRCFHCIIFDLKDDFKVATHNLETNILTVPVKAAL